MVRIRRLLLAITAFSLVPIVYITMFIHPLSSPRQNEKQMISTLSAVKPIMIGCCVSTVVLGDGVRLTPNESHATSGYRVSLKVNGAAYEVHAEPMKYGRTGFLSFSVDQNHVVRSEIRKVATRESHPLAQ
jgi:hypothetical protein